MSCKYSASTNALKVYNVAEVRDRLGEYSELCQLASKTRSTAFYVLGMPLEQIAWAEVLVLKVSFLSVY